MWLFESKAEVLFSDSMALENTDLHRAYFNLFQFSIFSFSLQPSQYTPFHLFYQLFPFPTSPFPHYTA